MEIDRRMGKPDVRRGAWVLRLLLVAFLAAVIALTGQSQALAEAPDVIEFSRVTPTSSNEEGGFTVGEPLEAYPVGVAVAPDGSVYVAEVGNDRIVKFNSDGKYDGFLPKSVALGPPDDRIYVADPPDAAITSPYGVAVAPDGSVYVADTDNNRIVKFDSDGKYDAEWTEESARTSSLFSPFGVAVASDGSGIVYVADSYQDRIVKFDSKGVFVGIMGVSQTLDTPSGVAVAPDGSVYVADTNNSRILKILPDGKNFDTEWNETAAGIPDVTDFRGLYQGLNLPWGIAVASDDNGDVYVYVADLSDDYSVGRIVKFGPDGEYDTDWVFEVPSELPGGDWIDLPMGGTPLGIAVGPDGSGIIYVADTSNNRILKITDTDLVSSLADGSAGNGSDSDCSDQSAFKAMIKEKGIDFGNLIDCVALNQESLVDPGQLVSVKIEPQGRAGSSENVKISFRTANPMPEEGQVVVTLPEGFGVGDNTEVTLEVDGGSVSVDSSTADDARSVTAVFRTPIKAGDDVVLVLSDIDHPEVSGKPTEGGGVETQSLAADPIDSCLPRNDGCTIEYTEVKPGALTTLVFDLKAGELNRVGNLSHTAAGSTGEVFVSFRTTNPVPADGKVVVTFPKGFEVGTGIDVMGFEVGLDEDSDYWKAVECEGGCPSGSRSVTITVGEGIGAGELVRLKLSDIKNPEVTSGVNGEPQGGGIVTYSDNTAEDGTFVVIDGACEAMLEGSDIVNGSWPQGIDCASGQVTVDPITPGKLSVSKDGIKLGNEKAGGTGDVTVTFTLDNPLPANGAIAVTFPKGFVLNSGHATEATLLKPDGGTVDRVTVIEHTGDERTTALIRLKSLSRPLNENDEVQVKLTNIRNPQVSGQTQNFEIRTSVGK
jgi:sugar lactone lactonase YvrE